MQDIIEALKNALSIKGEMLNLLQQNSTYTWYKNYPVAIVHDKKRIKDEKVVSWMESRGMLESDGLTPLSYDEHTIDLLQEHASAYLKQVSIMCLEGTNKVPYHFREKRPHDYWKKIENPGNLKAVVEISQYEKADMCEIESHLRDLMRSSKEVPVLKELGFVWVVRVANTIDIEQLLRHYFPERYEIIRDNKETTYIGWSDTLREVNMRYFVCPVV